MTVHGRGRRRRAVAGLLAFGLLAAACGGDDDKAAETTASANSASSTTASSAATDSSSATPSSGSATPSSGSATPSSTVAPAKKACTETKPGSTLTASVFLSTGQLDPTLVAGGVVGGTEIAALYDVLFTYDYEKRDVVPHLAKGIVANADFTKFTLSLREGIKFSDGTPLDAQMVVNNFDRWKAPESTAPQAALLRQFMSGAKVVDPTTVEIDTNTGWAEFPAFLAEQVGMIVNTKVAGTDRKAFAAKPPDAAGVGPYVLETNAVGEAITFKARKDYWGGPVCVETLRIISIPGARATYESFQNDESQVAYLQDPATIKEAKANNEQGEWHSADVGAEILLNVREGHAAHDPRLREAMWLAVDAEQLNQRVYGGERTISNSLISPESPWASPGLAEVKYDPERAKQLVAEAKAAGVSANVEFLADVTPPIPDLAVAVKTMLEQAGFTVTIKNVQLVEKIPQVFKGEFDITNWALSIEPAEIATRLYGAHASGATNNRGDYRSPEMDQALKEAMAAPTDKRAAAIKKVNDIFVKDHVSIVFDNMDLGIVWKKNVHGVITAPTSIYLFHNASID